MGVLGDCQPLGVEVDPRIGLLLVSCMSRTLFHGNLYIRNFNTIGVQWP